MPSMGPAASAWRSTASSAARFACTSETMAMRIRGEYSSLYGHTGPPPYNGRVDVSDIGEFGLIERLAKAVGASKPEGLIVGIGDDAAAWRVNGAVMLATTDTLVEGVHFLPGRTPWADLGWKALAVNVSDIAAMGGEPQYALVTLGLPPETPVQGVDELYEGLRECAREYGVAVAGGDVVRGPQGVGGGPGPGGGRRRRQAPADAARRGARGLRDRRDRHAGPLRGWAAPAEGGRPRGRSAGAGPPAAAAGAGAGAPGGAARGAPRH